MSPMASLARIRSGIVNGNYERAVRVAMRVSIPRGNWDSEESIILLNAAAGSLIWASI